MPGPPPKDQSTRRRRNPPSRGEWTPIPSASDRPVPRIPTRPRGEGAWTVGTRRAWVGWWTDGSSLTWSAADFESVVMLAYLWQKVEDGNLRLASEVRLRMDGLGLSPKGKRDLRLRVVDEPPAVVLEVVTEDRRAARRLALAEDAR